MIYIYKCARDESEMKVRSCTEENTESYIFKNEMGLNKQIYLGDGMTRGEGVLRGLLNG